MDDSKVHWEHIYKTKIPQEVSWTENKPNMSLELISKAKLPLDAQIIDVGGGDSQLVDYLIDLGYKNLTVLDISETAIIRAQKRLGDRAAQVKWVVSDVIDYKPKLSYDLWHDRASFHFQTSAESIKDYLTLLNRAVKGHVIIGAFSTNGPKKCSGLDIMQYNEASLKQLFEKNGFESLSFEKQIHITPFKTEQEFIFGSFTAK
jgi:SAM-dependent methyltransferase